MGLGEPLEMVIIPVPYNTKGEPLEMHATGRLLQTSIHNTKVNGNKFLNIEIIIISVCAIKLYKF